MDIIGIAKSHHAGIQKTGNASSRMEAVRFPPGEDNRMRRRMSIWGISSWPCGKARSPKSRRIGQAFPEFWQNGESGSRGKFVRSYGKGAGAVLNDRGAAIIK